LKIKNNIMLKTTTLTSIFLLMMFLQMNGQIQTVVQHGHMFDVKEIAIAPRGNIIATTDGADIKIWDLKTGLEISALETGEGRIMSITDLCFVSDTPAIFLGYHFNGKLVLQEVSTSKLIAQKAIHKIFEFDSLNAFEIIDRKYVGRNEDQNLMQKYYKSIREENKVAAKEWEKYLDQEEVISTSLSGVSKRVLITTSEKCGRASFKRFKKKFRRFRKINSHYENKHYKGVVSEDEREKLSYFINKPRKKKETVTLIYKPIGKKHPLMHYNISKKLANINTVDTKNVTLSRDEKFAIVGKAVIHLHPKKPKRQRSLIGILYPKEYPFEVAFTPNNKYVIAHYHSINNDSSVVRIYDLSRSVSEYKKKNLVKRDTAFTLPLIYQFTCEPIRKITPSPETDHLILLYKNGNVADLNINSKLTLTDYFMEDGTLPFRETHALSADYTGNKIIFCGRDRQNQSNKFKVWDCGKRQFAGETIVNNPPSKLKFKQLQGAVLTTELYEPTPKISSGMSLIQLQNYKHISSFNFNLSNLINKDFEFDQLGIYSSDLSKYIMIDSENGFILLFSNQNNPPVHLASSSSDMTVKWSSSNNYIYGSNNKTICIWSGTDGSVVSQLPLDNALNGVTINDKEKILYISDNESRLTRWSFANSKPTELPQLKLKKFKSAVDNFRTYNKMFKNAGGIKEFRNQFGNLQHTLKKLSSVAAVIHNFNPGKLNIKKIGKNDIGNLREKMSEIKHKSNDTSNETNKPEGPKNAEPNDSSFQWAQALSNTFNDEFLTSNNPDRFLLVSGNGYEALYYDLKRKENKHSKRIFRTSYMRPMAKYKLLELLLKKNPMVNNITLQELKQAQMRNNILNYIAVDNSLTKIALTLNPQTTRSKIIVYDLNKKLKKRKLKVKDIPLGRPFLSPSGRYLAVSSDGKRYNIIKIFDLQNRRSAIKTLIGHSGEISFSEDEQLVISSGSDMQLKVWNFQQPSNIIEQPVFTYWAGQNAKDYLLYTQDGYYASTKPNLNEVAFRKGYKTYPLEQFDLTQKRPDIVLHNLKFISRDTSAINEKLYYEFYKYRIHDTNNFNSLLKTDFNNLPVVTIPNDFPLVDTTGR